MKLALAQMRMTSNLQENFEKSMKFCDMAKDSDLLFFPEIQLTPFFPQYEKRNVDVYCLTEKDTIPLFGSVRMVHGKIWRRWFTLRRQKDFMSRIIILRLMMDLKFLTHRLEGLE